MRVWGSDRLPREPALSEVEGPGGAMLRRPLLEVTTTDSQFETKPQFKFGSHNPTRSLHHTIFKADGVWRVLPVGTGRRLRNGRVA
jgi:hypothetical protein